MKAWNLVIHVFFLLIERATVPEFGEVLFAADDALLQQNKDARNFEACDSADNVSLNRCRVPAPRFALCYFQHR